MVRVDTELVNYQRVFLYVCIALLLLYLCDTVYNIVLRYVAIDDMYQMICK